MVTVVEGNSKTPFSIATTPRCRGGSYSFPGLLHFTLETYLIMLRVEVGGIKYHFWVLDLTRPVIEPQSTGPLATTLPLCQWAGLWNDENAFKNCENRYGWNVCDRHCVIRRISQDQWFSSVYRRDQRLYVDVALYCIWAGPAKS